MSDIRISKEESVVNIKSSLRLASDPEALIPEIEYERAHKNRSTVIKLLEAKIKQLEKSKYEKPRSRRLDLINSLPAGGQKRIAKTLNISKGYVSQILNGKTNQDSERGRNVIRLAEQAAGRQR